MATKAQMLQEIKDLKLTHDGVIRLANTASREALEDKDKTIEALKKDLANAETMKSYNTGTLNEVKTSLENVHAILDGIKGVAPRSYEQHVSWGVENRDNPVVVRLTSAIQALLAPSTIKEP